MEAQEEYLGDGFKSPTHSRKIQDTMLNSQGLGGDKEPAAGQPGKGNYVG